MVMDGVCSDCGEVGYTGNHICTLEECKNAYSEDTKTLTVESLPTEAEMGDVYGKCLHCGGIATPNHECSGILDEKSSASSSELEALINSFSSEMPQGQEMTPQDYSQFLAADAANRREEDDLLWKARHRNTKGRPYGVHSRLTIDEYKKRGRRRRIARASRKGQGKKGKRIPKSVKGRVFLAKASRKRHAK
jgi:hypothetical protein